MRRPRFAPTFAAWKEAAKEALARHEAPGAVHFGDDAQAQKGLFDALAAPRPSQRERSPLLVASNENETDQEGISANKVANAGRPRQALRLPRAFIDSAQLAAVHRDPQRWDLLYRLLWRLAHDEPFVLRLASDPDVLALERARHQVERDVHKCHAFVRFRAVADASAPDGRHFVAWYEPDHFTLALSAPHFAERFPGMHFSILTPDASVTCVHKELSYGPGATPSQAPGADELEELWKTYYASIFNPARLNLRAQRQEMPQRFWRNAPEAALNRELARQAPRRAEAFIKAQPPRAQPRDDYADLPAIAADLRNCLVCPWATQSTQPVGGEGPPTASLMLVGEQPGDMEDRQNRPFVGPAGRLLDRALVEAGIDRKEVYVTNAVKHFKFEPRGKRRLHSKPNATDVAACRGWLGAEINQVKPHVVVCLGTTAALSIFGKAVRLHATRGEWHVTPACDKTLVTNHPSAILRMPDDAQQTGFAALVEDLRMAAKQLDRT